MAKGRAGKGNGELGQAELPFPSWERGDAPMGEIGRVLRDNRLAKEEMARALRTMGFSLEATERLLRLDPEVVGGEDNEELR